MKDEPNHGYYPQPSKSFLVVHTSHVSEDEEKCSSLGIKVVLKHSLLGWIIRSYPEKVEYVGHLVKKWISKLVCLAMIASSQPRAAFPALPGPLNFGVPMSSKSLETVSHCLRT